MLNDFFFGDTLVRFSVVLTIANFNRLKSYDIVVDHQFLKVNNIFIVQFRGLRTNVFYEVIKSYVAQVCVITKAIHCIGACIVQRHASFNA